jgi:hypothetical protein
VTNTIETRRDELLEEMRTLADTDLEGEDLELFERLESEVETLNKRIKVFGTARAAQANGRNAVESGDGIAMIARRPTRRCPGNAWPTSIGPPAKGTPTPRGPIRQA